MRPNDNSHPDDRPRGDNDALPRRALSDARTLDLAIAMATAGLCEAIAEALSDTPRACDVDDVDEPAESLHEASHPY
jgi:hypothetical protein